jgi:hypothetical protein
VWNSVELALCWCVLTICISGSFVCSTYSFIIIINTDVIRSRGSSDSIVSGYELEDRAIEFRYPAEAREQTGS